MPACYGLGLFAVNWEEPPDFAALRRKENTVFAVQPPAWIPDIPSGGGVRISGMACSEAEDTGVLLHVGYDDWLPV